jgi:DNA ligase-associated metallophosphoesterase
MSATPAAGTTAVERDASATLAITLAGESVVLDGDRALYWPARRTLVVGDVHLGKGQVLREAGIALPTGSSERDLMRLAALVARHAAKRLLVLGDLVHGRTHAAAGWRAAFGAWRDAHPALKVELVAGNHDRHERALAGLVDSLHDTCVEPPFVFAHEPGSDPRGYVLAGHLHPGIVLRERHGPALRIPAFWLGAEHGVLPAFGSLTGIAPIRARAGDRIYAATGTSVHLVRAV